MSYFGNLIKALGLKNGGPDHIQISSPANGRLFELAACSDPLFAQGTMGSGFVVFPDDGVVSSPVDGTVEMVYETLHAFGLRAVDGRERCSSMSVWIQWSLTGLHSSAVWRGGMRCGVERGWYA